MLAHAVEMRRHPTPAEQKLWTALRNEQLGGLKFRRQARLGAFIADFYCAAAKLVVEIDGETHVAPASDVERDAALAAAGILVVRFWNNQVMGNLEGVLQVILEISRGCTPPPRPLPHGEGEI